jgi:hypothetical protein
MKKKNLEKVKIGDLIMAEKYSPKPVSKTGYISQKNFVIGLVTGVDSSIYEICWADKKDTIEDTRFLEGEVEAWRKNYFIQREIMGL